MVKLDQSPRGDYEFDVPVEIGIYEVENPVPKISRFRMNTKSGYFTIPSEVKPEKVAFDPRIVLLARVKFWEKE